MKWIKHDSDAHRDAKLRKLVMAYGLEGYGLYWYCLEEIARNVTQHKFTFELEHDAEIIAFSTGTSAEKVETMMRKMVDLGLFEDSAGVITCLKLAKRLDQSMTSNPEMRKIISLHKNQQLSKNNHDPIMTESGNSHARIDKIRLEENRTDKKKTRRFTPPTVDEAKEYCTERKNSVDANRFIDFYSSKGWMVGKSKMKDWKAALRGWEKRAETSAGVGGLSKSEMANAL